MSTPIDLQMYRRLAAAGDANAKAIVEAEEGAGAQPQVAMDAGGSESDATDELVQFAQRVGALKAQADILAAAGSHKAAADIHMNRAREFDWRDQYGDAMRAYRDAAYEYAKHADEACSQLTAEQVKAWHAKGKA